jgi:hypothetical protein
MFTEMQSAYAEQNLSGGELRLQRFLSRFDCIFTLNQDTFLETHYAGAVRWSERWQGSYLPKMRFAGIALDGEAQDRELERRETSDKPPSDTEVREEERLHFMMKKKLLEVARYHLTAPETTWSSAPARDYSAGSHLPVETVDEAIKTTKARRTVWDDE